jgi:hypothetical protein
MSDFPSRYSLNFKIGALSHAGSGNQIGIDAQDIVGWLLRALLLSARRPRRAIDKDCEAKTCE